jgi:hypothetical protein
MTDGMGSAWVSPGKGKKPVPLVGPPEVLYDERFCLTSSDVITVRYEDRTLYEYRPPKTELIRIQLSKENLPQ